MPLNRTLLTLLCLAVWSISCGPTPDTSPEAGADVDSRDAGAHDVSADAAAPDTVNADIGSSDLDTTPRVVLSNVAQCTATDFLLPDFLSGEAHHLAAATLTPESYPTTVDRVHYALIAPGEIGRELCQPGLAHRVEVYVSNTPRPSNTPSVEAVSVTTLQLEANADATERREVTATIDPPVTLEAGQHLIVAVELPDNEHGNRALCIEYCVNGGTAARNWWSNAIAEPYGWYDLVVDSSVGGDCTISASGPVP